MNHAASLSTQTKRLPENEPGRYSVNSECIDCDLCRETAPDNFRRDNARGCSYVYQQPQSKREEQLCALALHGCPVTAIEDEER